MLYPERDFLDRFSAARADGFAGVEFMFPYSYPAEQILSRLQERGLAVAVFNAYPGDLKRGDFGLAAVPGREDEFAKSVETTIRYARALMAERIHVLAGLVPESHNHAIASRTYINNLRDACARASEHDITLLIEPINRRDVPDYFLHRLDDAREVISEVGADNLRIQLDLYHTQITEGDLATKCEKYLDYIGHIQVAGVPYRCEPNVGEVNFRFLFELLDELGYGGWIGCEYRPLSVDPGGTSGGLGWLNEYRKRLPE